ncbi:MAG: FAD/NAD(P)-binding protein [Candidatus Hadarchaeales archaeon]
MSSPYLPQPARILEVIDETPNIKTFVLEPEKKFEFSPGQFLELTAFGVGEAPFAISSPPHGERLEMTVMRTFDPSLGTYGRVTSALHRMGAGEVLGIRGPYGNSYPVKESEGKDILIVGGGIGLSTLRSYLLTLLHEREKYGRILLFYGARTPADLVFKREYEEWKRRGAEVHLSVDVGTPGWTGNVGVVTTLFDRVKLDFRRELAVVCGPPIMIRFTVERLLQVGYEPPNIYVSLERKMRCGIGKCGHCNIEKYYVCKDGPIFSFEKLKGIPEWW